MNHGNRPRRAFTHGPAQRYERFRHRRQNSFRRLALYHPQLSMTVWKQEIHLQTLLVAKMVELFPPAPINLALENLSRNVSLEKRTEKGRAFQFSLCRDSQKIAGGAGVSEIHLRR